jgi:hypothetical protein
LASSLNLDLLTGASTMGMDFVSLIANNLQSDSLAALDVYLLAIGRERRRQ